MNTIDYNDIALYMMDIKLKQKDRLTEFRALRKELMEQEKRNKELVRNVFTTTTLNDVISILYCGHEIHIYSNGTWGWTDDTSGC